MTDIDPLAALPVRVQGVEVQDPILTLFGEGWALTIACPWEGTIGGRALSWEDPDIEDRSWDLVGEDLVAVRQGGPAVEFEFTTGSLTVTPDIDVDPWVLQLPGGLVVGRTA
jgi:hypothetical protein